MSVAVDLDEPEGGYSERLVWQPQKGPQEALVNCPITLIGYGGARGGGKTDGGLGKFAIKQEQLGDAFNAILFRKELPQADDLIERAKQIYLPLNAHWQDQKKQFTFPNGARLRFRPLAHDADAEKYQGQNLCVAVGTPIRMGDGSFRAIEGIAVGDYVATLLGARKVTAVTKPYVAPCVECLVLDQGGNEIGSQVHPVWHPVLTAYGVFSIAGCFEPHKSRTPHIDSQSKKWALAACSGRGGLSPDNDLKSLAWYAFSGDEKTYCKESSGGSPDTLRPPLLSVPVALHAQTVRLGRTPSPLSPCVAREFPAPHTPCEPLLGSSLVLQRGLGDFALPDEPSLQSQGLRDGVAHEGLGVQTSLKKVEDSLAGYPPCHDLCGEHSLQEAGIGLENTLSQGGAAESSRSAPLGESGTTQTHTHEDLPSWVHPYSGAVMCLAEDVVFGKMEVRGYGDALVTDLTVEEANHYISDTGLINKNSDALIEEAGNYANPSPIWKLFGALRGRGGGQIVLTFNPGGVGHGWLKDLFIRPAPKGLKILHKQLGNGGVVDYIYIPSRVHDNQILLAQDPGYIDRLHMVGSPELVRAWLEGDFEIHEGSYFPEFSSRHIVAPFNVPKHWHKYLGYDWGHRSPFAALWGAVSSGKDDHGTEVPYPKGSIIIYREMWGKGIDNVEQANRIASASVGEDLISVADPSIFKSDGGPSINDQLSAVFAKYKHPNFRRADNERVAGWSQIRRRLFAKPALLYIFATCPYLLETLPALAIDKRRPEDANSEGDDHACFVGSTKVVTRAGLVPIRDLVGVSGETISSDGRWHKFICRLTAHGAQTVVVTFTNGISVQCTPDHLFMGASSEWTKAGMLEPGELIRCVTYASNSYFRDVPRVLRGAVLSLRKVFQQSVKACSRIVEAAQGCLGFFQLPSSKGLSCSPQRRESSKQLHKQLRAAYESGAPIGAYDGGTKGSVGKDYERNGIASSQGVAWLESWKGLAQRARQEDCNSDANDSVAVSSVWQGLSDEAAHALEVSVLPSKLQNGGAAFEVKSVEYSTKEAVYCLGVADTGNFTIEGGLVVKNCDALRYLCMARLIDAKWEQPVEVFNKGKIRFEAYIHQMRNMAHRAKI